MSSNILFGVSAVVMQYWSAGMLGPFVGVGVFDRVVSSGCRGDA